MQQVMLGFYDLVYEAEIAGFPDDLMGELESVRSKFVDELEAASQAPEKGAPSGVNSTT